MERRVRGSLVPIDIRAGVHARRRATRRQEARRAGKYSPPGQYVRVNPHPQKSELPRRVILFGAKISILDARVEGREYEIAFTKNASFRGWELKSVLLHSVRIGARGSGIQYGLKRNPLGCPEIFNTPSSNRPQQLSANPLVLVFIHPSIPPRSAWHWWSARVRVV